MVTNTLSRTWLRGRVREAVMMEFDLSAPIALPCQGGPDWRAVSHRWLTAVVLVAVAGSALLGVAVAGLGSPKVAPAKIARWRGRAKPGAAVREDRLAFAAVEPSPALAGRVQIEQLAGISGDMRPHTYVSFDLGLQRGDAPDDGRSATAVAAEAPAASRTRPALPPQILFGDAKRPTPIRALGYAEGAAVEVEPTPLGEPLNMSTAERGPPPPPERRRVIAARPGDGLADILRAAGLPAAGAAEAAAILVDRHWFAQPTLRGDERITLDFGRDDEQNPQRIALARSGTPPRIAALADDGRYRLVEADASPAATDAGDATLRGDKTDDLQPLRTALAAAVKSRGVDPGLIDAAERLCAHDLDLEAPVSARDRVEMMLDGNAEQPRLASLRLDVGGHSYRYYRYDAPDDDSTDFYDPQGRSVTSFLLRKPVAAGRLGDGFGWRIHPVLGDRRFHQGVDYAAPFGSPIVAAGAGTVEKIDQQWGYGKYVRIRHDLGYETTYAHIAAVPRGLAVGQRVHQGETIAFVGSTGISTGPHLYYEVRINGHNVDPLTVRLAGGRVLSGPALLAFATARDRADGLLRAAETTVAAD